MGRAYYRFGHDIALRLPNGQAFALRNAELGATFTDGSATICFLRGNFTAATFRALMMRGVIAPNRALQTLTQPVDVQLNLLAEFASSVAQNATTLSQWGRRLDQNSLTDEAARKLLTFAVWRLVFVTPWEESTGFKASHSSSGFVSKSVSNLPDAEPKDDLSEIITDFASDLWSSLDEGIESAPPPSLTESVQFFFAEMRWDLEEIDEGDGVLRTVYHGQNGTWMCYIRILDGLDQVIFYSVCPIPVSNAVVPALCQYVCGLNAELSLGNFEVDFDHSSVRFRTSIDVTDVGLNHWLFRNLVFQNLAVMDVYLPELLRIIAGKPVMVAES